jgi:serine protease Do
MMGSKRWTLFLAGLAGGAIAVTALWNSTPVPRLQAQDEAPRPEALARADELSSAFRWVAKRTLPAIVSVRSIRKVNGGGGVAGMDPFEGTPFGRQFGGSPLDDLFGDLRERMREQQQGGDAPGIATGEGSGFIISADGVVMTNAHVVRGADEVVVIMADGSEYKAKEIKSDDFSDVAVLRIEADRELPTLPLGDDSKVEIGDWVLAFGSPFGLDRTVTQGIISAKSRGLKNLPSRQEFLQTDAAINPGNSGGPLVNLRGEVIGINTAIETRSGGYDGVGFAVPVSLAQWVGEQLLAGGKVRRAYLGVTLEDLTSELAGALELAARRGVVVSEVRKDSPADKAGVQVQDVILRLDGKEVSSRQQLITIAERLRIGSAYPLVVIRNGKEVELNVTAAEFPEQLADAGESMDELGVEVQKLTDEMAERLGMDSSDGVVITSVKRGSVAARIGLQPGVVVVRIGKTDINSVDDFREALKAAKERGQLVLLVKTTNGTQLLSVPFR